MTIECFDDEIKIVYISSVYIDCIMKKLNEGCFPYTIWHYIQKDIVINSQSIFVMLKNMFDNYEKLFIFAHSGS